MRAKGAISLSHGEVCGHGLNDTSQTSCGVEIEFSIQQDDQRLNLVKQENMDAVQENILEKPPSKPVFAGQR